jgi:hypothetical protein
MQRRKHEIIFEAEIDFSDRRQPRMRGELGEMEDLVRKALSEKLPSEMNDLFGITIDVQIKGAREGSLIVFFGIVFAGVGALSRYKSLYESIELIRRQSERVIGSALNNRDQLRINVRVADPSHRLVDAYRPNFERRLARFSDEAFSLSDTPSAPPWSPYAFFYFLLILCILETLAIGFLVYKAVSITYF